MASCSGEFSQISQDFGYMLATQVDNTQVCEAATQVAKESQFDTQVYEAPKQVLREDDLATQVHDFSDVLANVDEQATQLYEFTDVRSQIFELFQTVPVMDVSDEEVRVPRPKWRPGVLRETPAKKVRMARPKRKVKKVTRASTEPE